MPARRRRRHCGASVVVVLVVEEAVRAGGSRARGVYRRDESRGALCEAKSALQNSRPGRRGSATRTCPRAWARGGCAYPSPRRTVAGFFVVPSRSSSRTGSRKWLRRVEENHAAVVIRAGARRGTHGGFVKCVVTYGIEHWSGGDESNTNHYTIG